MAEPTEETPPSKAAKFAVPAIALLLGVGGGVGGAMMMGGGDKPAAEGEAPAEGGEAAAAEGGEAAAEGGEAAAEGGEGAPAEGAAAKPPPTGASVTNIGTFTVNLRGSGGGRVLRVEVQVETKAAHAESVTAKSAQIRDSIITAVSDYTWSELEGTDGKVRLRDELLTRVNGITAPTVVDRLYFTQFVVQ
jgi:flagellar FliL protein